MNIDTTGFKKSLFNSSGYAQISGSITLPDASSSAEIGVSGTSATTILFANSKVYDDNGKIIAAYAYGEPVNFILNSSLSSYDIFINEKPKIFSATKSSTGYDEYFVFNCTGSIDVDYYANSDKPAYSVTELITTDSISGDLTGYISNLSSKGFAVYSVATSADLISASCTSGIIAAGSSGAFTLSRSVDYTGGLLEVPLEINTNFGLIYETITISGAYSDSNNFSISLYGPDTISDSYQNIYTASVFSITGFDQFSIYLNHISGSGRFTQLTGFSGYGTNNYSGNITGSGYLNCVKTATLTGQSVTGDIIQSMTATGTVFAYATGTFSKVYQVPCYGIATGINYTGYSSGYVNYTATGSCPSGYFNISANVSGSPSGLSPIDLATQTNATGAIYYNVPVSGVTSDILYVGNTYVGIVFGFHYSSISGLASYLNANTAIHKVSASVSGANTILLSSSLGYEGNFIILDADNDNDGSMSVSGPTLQGGSDVVYTDVLSPSGVFTGAIIETYLHTGSYSLTQTGALYASGESPYLIRNFNDTWQLSTGYDAYTSVSLLDAGATGANGYLKSGVSDGLFYCYLDYSGYDSNLIDIVELSITGNGKNQTIRITGVQ